MVVTSFDHSSFQRCLLGDGPTASSAFLQCKSSIYFLLPAADHGSSAASAVNPNHCPLSCYTRSISCSDLRAAFRNSFSLMPTPLTVLLNTLNFLLSL